MMTKRNSIVSFLQAWGIILVVLGHCDYGASIPPIWHTWIYTFHMPLFMFISGFLLRYTGEVHNTSFVQMTASTRFIKKKATRLLIPYIAISTIAFIPKILLSQFAARPITFSFHEYIHMLIYPWDNVIQFFWFLPTLFLIFCIASILGKYVRRLKVPVWGCLASSLILYLFNPVTHITILNIGGVVNYLFYFSLGYFVCKNKMMVFIGQHPWFYLILTFVLSCILMNMPSIKILKAITAINGITMSFALGYLYNSYNCTILNNLYGASYTIYLFSWFPQVLSQQVFLAATGAPWWVGGILAFITGIYVPLLIFHLINKYRQNRIGHIAAVVSGM